MSSSAPPRKAVGGSACHGPCAGLSGGYRKTWFAPCRPARRSVVLTAAKVGGFCVGSKRGSAAPVFPLSPKVTGRAGFLGLPLICVVGGVVLVAALPVRFFLRFSLKKICRALRKSRFPCVCVLKDSIRVENERPEARGGGTTGCRGVGGLRRGVRVPVCGEWRKRHETSLLHGGAGETGRRGRKKMSRFPAFYLYGSFFMLKFAELTGKRLVRTRPLCCLSPDRHPVSAGSGGRLPPPAGLI